MQRMKEKDTNVGRYKYKVWFIFSEDGCSLQIYKNKR